MNDVSVILFSWNLENKHYVLLNIQDKLISIFLSLLYFAAFCFGVSCFFLLLFFIAFLFGLKLEISLNSKLSLCFRMPNFSELLQSQFSLFLFLGSLLCLCKQKDSGPQIMNHLCVVFTGTKRKVSINWYKCTFFLSFLRSVLFV